jgi:hypothetical protein
LLKAKLEGAHINQHVLKYLKVGKMETAINVAAEIQTIVHQQTNK